MRKITSVVICILMVCFFIPVVCPAQTDASSVMMTNEWGGYNGSPLNTYSDFESVDADTLKAGGYTFTDGALITNATDAYSGKGYIKIAAGNVFSFSLKGEPDATYVATGYYKHGTASKTANVQLSMREDDISKYNIYNNALVYTTEWTKFSIVLIANRTQTGEVSFYLNNGSGTAPVYLDDFLFVRLNDYDTKNLVPNRSFEFNDADYSGAAQHHYANWYNDGEARLVNGGNTGNYAMEVTDGNIYTWATLPAVNTSVKRYEFSASIKWQGGAVAPSAEIISYSSAGIKIKSVKYSFTAENGLTGSDWCRVRVILDEKQTTRILTSFKILLNSATGGVLWDDISIKPVENCIEILNDRGEVAKYLPSDGTGSYTAYGQFVGTEGDKNGRLYLAAYKYGNDGRLVLKNVAAATAYADGRTAECTLPQTQADLFRAFLWEGNMNILETRELEKYSVQGNLIENGGFEENDEVVPDNIGVYFGWGSRHAMLVTDEAHSGDYAARITAGGAATHLTIDVSGLFTGTDYIFSYWYKGNVEPGLGMNIRIRQKADTDSGVTLIRDYWASPVYSASEWTLYSARFTLYEGTAITIYPTLRSMQAETSVYIDDISLVPAEDAPIASIVTDGVFYYSDKEGDGNATVKLSPHFAGMGYTADIRLVDGETVIKEETGHEFNDENKAEFSFELTLLSEITKEYKVVADIVDTNGNVAQQVMQQVYRYNRPTTVTKDSGFTDINGKRIDPVFAYHIPYEDFATAASAGINVVQYSAPSDINECLAQLDEMYEMGVYAAVVCYWGMIPAGHPVNHDRVRDFILKIKHHPAIFCYMIMDEPFINNPNAHENLRRSYIMLRGADPDRPTYMCEGFPPFMEEVAKYTDIIAPDVYPGAGQSITNFVYDMVSYADMYAKYDRPVLSILQAFTYGGKKPSAIELHSMMYQTFLGGGNAVGVYTWAPDNPAWDKYIDEDFYWPMFQKFYAEEKTVLYDYYAHGKGEAFESYRGIGNIRYDIWYDESGENAYVAVQNVDPKNRIKARIYLENEKTGAKINPLSADPLGNGDDSAIEGMSDGRLEVWLEPAQAMLIKVVPQ